jgi:hypothetical protein
VQGGLGRWAAREPKLLQLQLMMPTGRFRHHADRTTHVDRLLNFNVLFLNIQFQSRQLLRESRDVPVWRSRLFCLRPRANEEPPDFSRSSFHFHQLLSGGRDSIMQLRVFSPGLSPMLCRCRWDATHPFTTHPSSGCCYYSHRVRREIQAGLPAAPGVRSGCSRRLGVAFDYVLEKGGFLEIASGVGHATGMWP